MDRFVVTDDLPTPPLPDAIGEYPGAGVGERIHPRFGRTRCSGGIEDPERIRRDALQDVGDCPELGFVHLTEIDLDPVDPGHRGDGVDDPPAELGAGVFGWEG